MVDFIHNKTSVGASSRRDWIEGPLTVENVRKKQQAGQPLTRREQHVLDAIRYGTIGAGDKY